MICWQFIRCLSVLNDMKIGWKKRLGRLYIVLGAVLILVPGMLPAQSLPDNIDSADCVFFPEGTEWVIGTPVISQNANAVILTTPMVGDIDDDGVPEIVVTSGGSNYIQASHINIYRPNGTLKSNFPLNVGVSGYYAVGMAKVQWQTGVYRTIIVTFGTNNYLYAYSPDGTQLWQSNTMFTNHNGCSYSVPGVSFLDINHDGWTELLVGSELYDAATGNLLCRDLTGNRGEAVRGSATDRVPYMAMAADLCGDSCLDLAIGNTVYGINLQSRTVSSANQMTVTHSVSSSQMVMHDGSSIPFTDGNTFLVDINLDGKSDVLVMNEDRNAGQLYVYIWDVGGDTIICSKRLPYVRKFGIPQIGDLDNDGYPEICFVAGEQSGVVSSSRDSIYALKYNPGAVNGEMEVFWTTSHSDRSGSTGLTLFDFNQDGLVELVYRDEWNLRIINGSLQHHLSGAVLTGPYDLATFSCGSSTVFEYPVIVDVDLDGAAEIVVGGDVPLTTSTYGHIYIFKSGGVPWAPARAVWNQYIYYVTNINEDLTVPLYQFNNATSFIDTQGVVRRPYNNILQQATTIDQYGRPFYAVPDAYVVSVSESYGLDSITLTVSICNSGDNALVAPYTMMFFEGQMGGNVIGQLTVSETLEVDSCRQLQLTLPYGNLDGVRDIVAAVNANANGIAQNAGLQAECDSVNNLFYNSRIYSVFDTVVCSSHLSLVWRDSLFTGRDTKIAILTASNGMDSVVVLHLQTILTSSSTFFDTVTENSLPHLFNGISFDHSVSDSIIVIPNAAGCDSIIHYNLYVHRNIRDTLERRACITELPIVWEGLTFDTIMLDHSVVMTRNIRTPLPGGVDSILTLLLSVNPIYETFDTIGICRGYPYIYRGVDYGGPKTFDAFLYSVYGCDSLVHVTLQPLDTALHVKASYSLDNAHWTDTLPILLCSPSTLYLRDSSALAVSWLWSLSSGETSSGPTPQFLIQDSTISQRILQLEVESAGGCRDTLLWSILLFPRPHADFQWFLDHPVDIAPNIRFIDNTTPEEGDRQWFVQKEQGGNDFDTLFGPDPFYTWQGNLPVGDFDVRLVAMYPYLLNVPDTTLTCTDTAKHTVTIVTSYLQFPNLVTPNGDGVNDTWRVINLLELGLYSMNELWIYNSWGVLVYHVEDIHREEQFWNPNDTHSPDGTYYFRFSAKAFHGLVRVNGAIEVAR